MSHHLYQSLDQATLYRLLSSMTIFIYVVETTCISLGRTSRLSDMIESQSLTLAKFGETICFTTTKYVTALTSFHTSFPDQTSDVALGCLRYTKYLCIHEYLGTIMEKFIVPHWLHLSQVRSLDLSLVKRHMCVTMVAHCVDTLRFAITPHVPCLPTPHRH